MNTLFDRLKHLFSGTLQHTNTQETSPGSHAAIPQASDRHVILDDRSLPRLLSLVEQTKEGEYACDETFDLLDEYAELVASGRDAEAIMPLVKGHLEHCVDCTERYEALLKILEG